MSIRDVDEWRVAIDTTCNVIKTTIKRDKVLLRHLANVNTAKQSLALINDYREEDPAEDLDKMLGYLEHCARVIVEDNEVSNG